MKPEKSKIISRIYNIYLRQTYFSFSFFDKLEFSSFRGVVSCISDERECVKLLGAKHK